MKKPDAFLYVKSGVIEHRQLDFMNNIQPLLCMGFTPHALFRKPENTVLVDRAVLSLVINALERDAIEGRSIRGEILDELKSSIGKLN